jgi:hypothetical protein
VMPAGKRSVAPSSNLTVISTIDRLARAGGRREVSSRHGRD